MSHADPPFIGEGGDAVEAQMRLVPPDYTGSPVQYSNFVQGTASPYDLTLHFGWFSSPLLAEPPTEPVDVPVRPLLSVTVPLNIVRGMIRVLESQLAAAEANLGQTPTGSEPSPDRGGK